MVGFHKHDSLTTSQKLLAGCLSGVVTRFIIQPLDIIKLRTQLQKTKKKQNVFKVTRKILTEEGLHAFYHGHLLGQMHSVVAVTAQFYIYELATKYVSTSTKFSTQSPYIRLLCGLFAGSITATLVTPLEVIRVRQMIVNDQYGGVIRGAKAVYKYGGIPAFFEGVNASILQLGPQVAFSFLVFSFTQPWILHKLEPHTAPPICDKDTHECTKGTNKHTVESVLLSSSLAGSAAGFISKTLTYPFDLAKRRLQIRSHKKSSKYAVPSTSKHLISCKSLFDCLLKTIQKQGLLGLYQGWGVTIGKAQVTSVLAYTTYELLCYALRETNAVYK